MPMLMLMARHDSCWALALTASDFGEHFLAIGSGAALSSIEGYQ